MISARYSRFLPFESYTILTTLSEEEILERLRIITKTASTIRFSQRKAAILRSNYDYEGKISGKTFEIWRSINYLNSFRPIIYGAISSTADKTEIRIAMKMHAVIRVLMIIILSILALVSLVTLKYFSVIPVILFVGFSLTVLLGFKLESRASKKDLKTIFKAETD